MRKYEQHPDETLDYTVDFERHCARYREPGTSYALNTAVRPTQATGLQYRASTAGVSGTKEPRWPTTAAQTVTDGSVVWTAEAIANTSLARTLSDATWTATTGLTVGTASESGTKSTALISGGTEGQDYEIDVVGTCSDGTEPVVSFTIQIRDPARVVDA